MILTSKLMFVSKPNATKYIWHQWKFCVPSMILYCHQSDHSFSRDQQHETCESFVYEVPSHHSAHKTRQIWGDLLAATGLVILLKFDPKLRFFCLYDLEIWWMALKNSLFYTTSSFVYHFKSIGGSKPKLQSRNAQFGSKLAIFCHIWPWNLMNDLGPQ